MMIMDVRRLNSYQFNNAPGSYKLFKIFLPRCGDFQLQGSITEIFYRLAKRGPQLLEFMQNKAARKSMESLLQSKHPDLLTDIRTIVTLINESLGHGRR